METFKIIGITLAVFVGGFFFMLYASSYHMRKAGQLFCKSLKTGHLTDAYRLLGPNLTAAISLENFPEFLLDAGITPVKEIGNFSDFSIGGKQGTMKVHLLRADDVIVPIALEMAKVGPAWKVVQLSVNIQINPLSGPFNAVREA